MRARLFRPGISALLGPCSHWIQGRRVGLVSHPAAVDRRGTSSLDLLANHPSARLVSLFGPEHGFFGAAGAGETVKSTRLAPYGLPVHSLYGEHRRPTPSMLRGVDVIVFDLQDLGVRCYTYVSTLRYVLEAAAACGKTVVVADRPVPLPATLDGPMLDPEFTSFVGLVPAPFVYGMTPGEAALWLRSELSLDVELKVAPMANYRRQPSREAGWPPWIPPSPGIRAWESAQSYAATVFCEAVPAVDNGRGTSLAFQLIGAPWLDAEALLARLSAARLGGVCFHRHTYIASFGAWSGKRIAGLRLTVTDAAAFRPVTTAIHILHAIQAHHGRRRLWSGPQSNPAFFDKLFGTDVVRAALLDGAAPAEIAVAWPRARAAFSERRRSVLLYPPQSRSS